LSSLPGLLGNIADIVGPDVALEIARHRGGTRVSIPPRAEHGHWLVDLVGFATADRICRGLATLNAEGKMRGVVGEVIPLGPASVLTRARRQARDAIDQGMSASEAARAAGLHERTIYRMKAKDKDQGSLF